VTPERIDQACKAEDESVADLVDGHSWALRGIGTMDDDGEELYEPDHDGITWITVEDRPDRDPPKQIDYARPQPEPGDRTLDEFGGSLN
jgi:hypothetical protein